MESDDTTSSARHDWPSHRHIGVHTIPKSRTQFNHNAQLAQCGSVEFAAERNLMTHPPPPVAISPAIAISAYTQFRNHVPNSTTTHN